MKIRATCFSTGETAQRPGGINIADEHIFIDNMKRINDGLRDPSVKFNFENSQDVARCRQMFEGALKASLELSKRNYKLVAPQFWPATGKLQFLMPIYLEGVQEIRKGEYKEVLPPTVALSIELVHGQYIGTTILTLDMAYPECAADRASGWLLAGRNQDLRPESGRRKVIFLPGR